MGWGGERRRPRDFLPSQDACVASLLATRASRLTTPAHRGWLSQRPCTSRGRCCRKPLPWPQLGGWLAAAVTPERFPLAGAQLGRRKRRPGPAELLQSSRLLCPGCAVLSAAPCSARGGRAPADAARIPGATAPPLLHSRSSRCSSGVACEAKRRQDEDDGGFRGVPEGLAPLQVTLPCLPVPSGAASPGSGAREPVLGSGH